MKVAAATVHVSRAIVTRDLKEGDVLKREEQSYAQDFYF
jgi:hypothetical protein